jgi:hypothetical protein
MAVLPGTGFDAWAIVKNNKNEQIRNGTGLFVFPATTGISAHVFEYKALTVFCMYGRLYLANDECRFYVPA